MAGSLPAKLCKHSCAKGVHRNTIIARSGRLRANLHLRFVIKEKRQDFCFCLDQLLTFRLNGDATASHILTMVDFLPCCPLFHIQMGWEQMTELVLSGHRLIVRPHIVMV